MKKLTFSALDESCFDEVLPCGLRIRVIPKRGFSRTYAFLAVNYGSIDTAYTLEGKRFRSPDGVAHYLEHKMFDLPEGDAMKAFARLGGSPNAFTSYEMTAYHVDCTENFEENLRVLLRLVATPYFTDESVEKERGIIAQEIRMYEDSADSRVYDNLFAAMYDHHPIRVPIAGTVKSIGEITTQTLTELYTAFYRPDNMMLCVMGDVSPERVASLAREAFSDAKRPAAASDYGAAEFLAGRENTVEMKMEVAMPTFVASFKCAPPAAGTATMKQEFVGDLAADLLVGESSPLYTALYEQGLIDSGFSAGYEGLKGVGMLSMGGDCRDPEAVMAAVLQEAERIARDGVDHAALARLKKSYLGRKTRELDSFEGTCFKMCAYYFDGVEYYDFPAVLRSVTAEDVERLLRDAAKKEHLTLSVIRPTEQEEET